MYNNGTTPQLILPGEKKLMPDLKPEMGVRLMTAPQGVVMTAYHGDQELPIVLPIQQAAELGVSLISVAALLQHGALSSSNQIAVSEPSTSPKV